MKAEIIAVPDENSTEPTVVLFDTGFKFRDCEIYLESTGNKTLDAMNRGAYEYHASKLNRKLKI